MSRQRRRRSGFTLVEILIVVAILAVLAAAVVPRLMQQGDEARIKIAETMVGRSGDIAGALKLYRLHSGKYPETEEGLEALFRRPSDIEEDSKKWIGPYLEGSPEELVDPWDNELVYECPGKYNEDGYDLSSKGPDGEEDTEDDIKNWTEQ